MTCEQGTNTLVGTDMVRPKVEVEKVLTGKGKRGKIPDLWDGCAGERVAQVLAKF